MKKTKLVILTVACTILLIGIHMTPDGGGNGNPALLLIIPFILLFLLLIIQLIKISRYLKVKFIPLIGLTILSTVSTIHTLQLQAKKRLEIREQIRQSMLERNIPEDQDYVDTVTSGLTQFTNSVYFNFYTITTIMLLFFTITFWLLFLKRYHKNPND